MHNIEVHTFNYIDYIIITLMLCSTAYGFFRGFIASLISFSGWVLSIILTYKFYPQIELYLTKYINSKTLIVVVGSGLLLLGLLLVFGLINTVFYKLVKNIGKNFNLLEF